MFKPYWTLNEAKTNGDTYGGLMNCFGLGIQNVKNIDKDRFLPDRDIEMSGILPKPTVYWQACL